MGQRILVTGGAGFIGRRASRVLLQSGHEVRVLDSLAGQVHGPQANPEIPEDVEFLTADVRDPAAVAQALRGVEQLVHLAAEVGVGQRPELAGERTERAA